VVKGAFPEYRVQQGLDQLIHLYTLAGFSGEELTGISSRILDLHRNSEKDTSGCFWLRNLGFPFLSLVCLGGFFPSLLL